MTLLGGRYQLGERVGHGGMAEVYAARDVRLGRTVAVKVLHAALARDRSFHQQFRREAQSAAALGGATIVSVYDTGEDEHGAPYIVMEYVEGRTLRDVIETEGRLLPTRALEIAADVCAALQAAHSAGIVHRDIKPGNVMLTPTGAVKVMDFGIARAAADAANTMTQSAAVIGTAAYLSPEQARGEHIDARSDLYSTGCLLYELVTGFPPFRGETPIAVAYQHVQEDAVPPSAYDASLPPAVDAVVLMALAKDPAQRYPSAEAMREDVLRAAAGQPVLAPTVLPPPAPPAAPVPVDLAAGRRRRMGQLTAGLFALLLLGLCVLSAVIVRGLRQDADSRFATAPDVVALSQAEAAARLADAGLRVGRVTPRFDQRPVGTVLRQDPAGRLALSVGGTVDLTVSQGLQRTTVPALIGLARPQAELVLEDARLALGEVQRRDGNLPTGLVLSVRPAPGTVVRTGTAVALVVASGRIAIPSVAGLPEQEAAAALQQAGFSVALQPRDSDAAPGTVIGQEPDGGTADRGSVITVRIARVPPPPPPPVSAAPVPPAPEDDGSGGAGPDGDGLDGGDPDGGAPDPGDSTELDPDGTATAGPDGGAVPSPQASAAGTGPPVPGPGPATPAPSIRR